MFPVRFVMLDAYRGPDGQAL